MPLDPDTSIGRGDGRFPTTRGSAVLAATRGEGEVRERALEALVAVYWKPVYKHLRLRWSRTNEDAKDLTQGFFATALEKGTFAGFDPSIGTFRTYLRTCLDRFTSNELKAAGRIKRGGGMSAVDLDFGGAEKELALQASDGGSPEDAFHREWARSLFALAIEQLQIECVEAGKERQFLIFERYDLDPPAGARPTYEAISREIDAPVTTVTNELAAARRRFRRIVLDRLRECTASESEFRAEARRLLGTDPS